MPRTGFATVEGCRGGGKNILEVELVGTEDAVADIRMGCGLCNPAMYAAADIVALVAFAVLTVVQRALVADSTPAWVITWLHAAVAVVVVPLLSFRAVRRWRARQAQPATGVPE